MCPHCVVPNSRTYQVVPKVCEAFDEGTLSEPSDGLPDTTAIT